MAESRRNEFRRGAEALVQPYLIQKKMTSCYVACGQFGSDLSIHEWSNTDPDLKYDLASLTKALATTPLTLKMLLDRGETEEARVAHLLGDLPGLSDELKHLSVDSLLSHRSGLPAWRNFWLGRLPVSCFDWLENRTYLISRLNTIARESALKEKAYVYSDVGFILLGLIQEILAKEDLSKIFHRFCRVSLGFRDSPLAFSDQLQSLSKEQFVPSAFCRIRQRILCGEVHDENSAAMGGISGHAGLFGSGRGLVKFLDAYLSSDLGRYFTDKCKFKLTEGSEMPNVLGWKCSRVGQDLQLGHLGFTGVSFWASPERAEFQIILTNRIISSRQAPWMTSFRQEMGNFLAGFR
ncbi:MAG: serine hydrolase [Oligoflexales bacterium]|nr:serine hydrolase [Oligoflexales bacterium]